MRIKNSLALWPLILVLLLSSVAGANEVERERLEQLTVNGLSLNRGARAAFEALMAAGYNTDIEKYEQWTEAARSFVKGDPASPSSSPDGWTEVILERNGHRLRAIRISKINPNKPFDAEEEIQIIRTKLGIAPDARRCTGAGPNGYCEAKDAEGNAIYFLQLLASNQRYEQVQISNLPAAALE